MGQVQPGSLLFKFVSTPQDWYPHTRGEQYWNKGGCCEHSVWVRVLAVVLSQTEIEAASELLLV